jgi:hypothetical protein
MTSTNSGRSEAVFQARGCEEEVTSNQPSQRVAENLGLVVARTSDNHGRWSSSQLIFAASL